MRHVFLRKNFAAYKIHLPYASPELAKRFRVASIKHMGHHTFELPNGKDTTLHFESGAICSAGIDKDKSVLTLEGTDIYTVLDIYAFLGFDYVVVEGFKGIGFPSAVLGELDMPSVLMRNPTVEEVVLRADEFMEYVPRKKE